MSFFFTGCKRAEMINVVHFIDTQLVLWHIPFPKSKERIPIFLWHAGFPNKQTANFENDSAG